MKKKIILTSLVASLSLIGLASCSDDKDNSVEIKDANGNTVIIEKTDDKEKVVEALNTIGSTNTSTLSRFGVSFNAELNAKAEAGSTTGEIALNTTNTINIDFNDVTFTQMNPGDLTDEQKQTISNSINNTELYIDSSANVTASENQTTNLSVNESIKAYKSAGTDSKIYLQFGENKVETNATEEHDFYDTYEELSVLNLFTPDIYELDASTLTTVTEDNQSTMRKYNNALYSIQNYSKVLNINSISKAAAARGANLGALIETFGIGVEISNVNGKTNTVEFTAEMSSTAFSSLINLQSDDVKLEATDAVYSITLKANAITGYISSLSVDFSNFKASTVADEEDPDDVAEKFDISTAKASIEFKYNDEVQDPEIPAGPYKTITDLMDKFVA